MCEGLKYNFLYKSDINSIHILLNLYDIEDNIKNIYPKYVSTENVKKHIRRILRNKNGKDLIALNLCDLISEDINRLELYIYLEGYKKGYFDNCGANLLENHIISHVSIEEIYNSNYLYHFEMEDKKVLEIRNYFYNKLESMEREANNLEELIKDYSDQLIKRKILNLNKYLDKQLTIEYSSTNYNIKEDNSLLTTEELKLIYFETVKVIFKSGLRLYKKSYWYGINDRVLRRYR